jgi:hypothetical protein
MKITFNSKLNDIKSKQPKKTLVVNKISPGSNLKIENEVKNLFDNPNTFLQLPSDSKLPFVVGRRLQGPRYDLDDKLIPYSIVGNPKFLKNKTNINVNNSISRSLYSQQHSRSTMAKNNNTIDNTKSSAMSDNQIKAIFSKCKYNIENNNIKKNDFLKTIPNSMNDYVIRPLLIQEKNLKLYKNNLNFQKRFNRNLIKRLYISTKNDPSESNRVNLLQESDNYITKTETLRYMALNDKKINFGNGLQNWSMSLRRPKNFEGERRGYVNVGNDNKPYWIILREKYPNQFENIMNPNNINNEFDKAMYKTQSFNKYISTFPNFKKFMNKTYNIWNLEVKGKNLLKVEEDNYKQLKGKTKRLVHLKYDRDSMKDLNICENWKYKTFD